MSSAQTLGCYSASIQNVLLTGDNKRTAPIKQDRCQRLEVLEVYLKVGIEVTTVACFDRDDEWAARVKEHTS